jgi:hypothetical protein
MWTLYAYSSLPCVECQSTCLPFHVRVCACVWVLLSHFVFVYVPVCASIHFSRSLCPGFVDYLWVSVNTFLLACVWKFLCHSVCLCVCECMHEPECVRVFDSKYSCVCCSISVLKCLLLLGFNLIEVKIKEKYFVLIFGHVWLGKFQLLLTYHTFNYII